VWSRLAALIDGCSEPFRDGMVATYAFSDRSVIRWARATGEEGPARGSRRRRR